MTYPLITVIITTCNRPTFVVEAVESVFAQTYSPIEVIVVDDGSGPDTATALAPYMSRVRYIYQSRRGPAAARNRGLRFARGELIAFLDDDDKWMPEKLHRQVEYLNRHPEVGLLHTETLRWNYRADRFEKKEGSIRDTYVGWCFDRLFFYGNSIMPSTVLIRRQCVERIGFFAEEFLHIADDYDYFLRISKQFPVGFISEPLIYYRLHDNNISKSMLAIAEGDFLVLQKALDADNSLWRTLGKYRVKERLYSLCVWAGYLLLDDDRFGEAHAYFTRAVKYRPTDLRAWALALATALPKVVVRPMKSFHRRVGRFLCQLIPER
jgi:glycosyltransferase involved in cell wall biosynthesis